MHSKSSFTLIELLVVIAIVGILAGIIIVSMSGATDQATLAKAKVFANSMRDSMAQSIVSEWKFDGSGVADDDTATTDYTKDTWGVNSSSIIYGNPLVESGNKCIYGSCLNFDGVDDYISYGSNVTMDLTQGYTASAWAKYDTITGSRGVMRRYASSDAGWFILGYRNTATAANIIYCFIVYTDTSNTTKTMTAPVTLKENNWYYLVLTVGSNGVSKFYVNGVVVSTLTPPNFSKLGGVSATNTTQLTISDSFWLMDGLIDEARVYNTPMPSSQIRQQYYAGLQKLLANGGIDKQEYQKRISSLNPYCVE